MNKILAACVALLAASAAPAEDVVREFAWDAIKAEGRLGACEVIPPGPDAPFHALRVVSDKAQTVTILTIDSPDARGRNFALDTQVRFEGASDKSLLEMWVHIPGGPYFSRRPIRSSSHARPYRVPFKYLQPDPAPSEKVVLNVVFSGAGRAHVGPVRLVRFAPGEDPFADPNAWWGVTWDSDSSGFFEGDTRTEAGACHHNGPRSYTTDFEGSASGR